MHDKDNTNDNDVIGTTAPCQECGAGVLRLRRVTYFTWLNEELITVPNFPAWICDVCGLREFDPRAVTWLNTMLNPSTGRKPKVKPEGKSGVVRVNRSNNWRNR